MPTLAPAPARPLCSPGCTDEVSGPPPNSRHPAHLISSRHPRPHPHSLADTRTPTRLSSTHPPQDDAVDVIHGSPPATYRTASAHLSSALAMSALVAVLVHPHTVQSTSAHSPEVSPAPFLTPMLNPSALTPAPVIYTYCPHASIPILTTTSSVHTVASPPFYPLRGSRAEVSQPTT
ncbi:hypothetical protein FS749_005492 [Ceratobasidium sp. UAMH 11750]|nr:hypothetical protein FS749_005492 [Ceratobasidium sp. UAMH 11750]